MNRTKKIEAVFFVIRDLLAIGIALLISFLPEFLRFADNYRTLIYCVLLVLIVRFMPCGLLGDASPIVKCFRSIFHLGKQKGGRAE